MPDDNQNDNADDKIEEQQQAAKRNGDFKAEGFENLTEGSEVGGTKIVEITERTKEYVVFITERNQVEFHAVEGTEAKIDQEIFRRWGILHASWLDDFDNAHRMTFLRLMATAVGSILSATPSSNTAAKSSLDVAKSYLESRANEKARISYLTGILGVAGACLLLYLILGLVFGDFSRKPSKESANTTETGKKAEGNDRKSGGDTGDDPDSVAETEVIIVDTATARDKARRLENLPFFRVLFLGTIGALLSVLQRLGSFPSDPAASNFIHGMDGGVRVFLGGLFSLVGAFGFYANVFFGFIAPTTAAFPIAVCLIAIVSGASERLIPNLITSFSQRAMAEAAQDSGSNPAVNGGG